MLTVCVLSGLALVVTRGEDMVKDVLRIGVRYRAECLCIRSDAGDRLGGKNTTCTSHRELRRPRCDDRYSH